MGIGGPRMVLPTVSVNGSSVDGGRLRRVSMRGVAHVRYGLLGTRSVLIMYVTFSILN